MAEKDARSPPEAQFQPNHWTRNLRSGHSDFRSRGIGKKTIEPQKIGKPSDSELLERRERFLNVLSVLKAEETAANAPGSATGENEGKMSFPTLNDGMPLQSWASYAKSLGTETPKEPEPLPEPEPLMDGLYPELDLEKYLVNDDVVGIYRAVREAVLSRLPAYLVPVYQRLRPIDDVEPQLPSFMSVTHSASARALSVVEREKPRRKMASVDPDRSFLRPTASSRLRTESQTHDNLQRTVRVRPDVPRSHRSTVSGLPRVGSDIAREDRTVDLAAQWATLFAGLEAPPPAMPPLDTAPSDRRLMQLRRQFFEKQMRDFAKLLLAEVKTLSLSTDEDEKKQDVIDVTTFASHEEAMSRGETLLMDGSTEYLTKGPADTHRVTTDML